MNRKIEKKSDSFLVKKIKIVKWRFNLFGVVCFVLAFGALVYFVPRILAWGNGSVTKDTSTDFSQGTLSQAEVSGSGSGAVVELSHDETYQSEISADAGLVSYWKMDNNWQDSESANHGTGHGTSTSETNTSLLLHMDGTDASTSFIDESGKTMTAIDNAQIDTAQYKFGTASSLFDGTGDYLSTAANADFNFNSSNFTIDGWFKLSNLGTVGQTIFAASGNNNAMGVMYDYNNSGKLSLFLGGGSSWDIASDVQGTKSDYNTTDWYHIALTWNGSTYRLFINGTLDASVTSSTGIYSTIGMYVGMWSTSVNYPLFGWVDEFRVSKGTARWTSNFTPPTSSYASGPAFGTAKQGTYSGSFNGISDFVDIPTVNGVKTVEFWVNNSNATDGVLQLTSGAYISIAGSAITTTGFTSPTIYVNGSSSSAALGAGWNHVVVTSDTAVNATAFKVGLANSDYSQGSLDEVAVYSSALSAATILDHYQAHYVSGTYESPTDSNVLDMIYNGGWGDGTDGSTAFSATMANVGANSTINFKMKVATTTGGLVDASYIDLGTANSGTTFTKTKAQMDVLGLATGTNRYVQVKATLAQTDDVTPQLDSYTLYYREDVNAPETNASALAMKKVAGGADVLSDGWTNNLAPYFSWTDGVDSEAGLKGYCLYLGASASGNPNGNKGLLGTSPVDITGTTCQFIINATSIDFATLAYRGSPWLTTSTDPYYLNIKAIDAMNNMVADSAQFQFRFDNTAPTTTSVNSNKINGTYKAGDTIDIDVTFSETVTSTGDVIVTLDTGGVCQFLISNATAGTCDYVVGPGENSSDLNVADISGVIKDPANNTLINFTPAISLATNKALVIDTGEPTITSVNSDKINGTYKVGDTIDIDVTFSETVTSTGNVIVTLDTGGVCQFLISNATAGTCDYVVGLGENSSDLNVASIAGTIKDQVGNALSDFAPNINLAANKVLVIDTIAPTISINTPVATPTNDPTPNYVFNSNEGGTINYTGACSSATSVAISGVNTITFSALATNTYDNCALTVSDAVGNVSNSLAVASFMVDATEPEMSTYFSLPGDFISYKGAIITWPTVGGDAASDVGSGLLGLQYRIGPFGTWYGAEHNGNQDITDVLDASAGTYTFQDPIDFDLIEEGANVIYLRALDVVGNVSNTLQGTLKINIIAPSMPQNLLVTPDDNDTNSYAFEWDVPNTFTGQAANITYCYTVNMLPSLANCVYTAVGITSLVADAFATTPGENTFYLVARDEADNINYDTYASVVFDYSGSAPGIPRSVDVADISVKASSSWKLVTSWDEPVDLGAGIDSYKIFRSETDTTCSENFGVFQQIGSTSGTSYSDTGLEQKDYYYCVKACDNANNCSAASSTATEYPSGKYTEAAKLTSAAEASGVTTKRATISWTTDREADSKVAYGEKGDDYYTEEPSNSEQITAHEINLTNLSPGTTYAYKAKWTDEDGNTGISSEKTFKTDPAPTIEEAKAENINLSSVTIKFTSKDASQVKIYYGKSTDFGAAKEVSTSASKSTYTVQLSELEDGAKYYYKINTFDSEDEEYEGDINSFTTLPRPKISDVKIQEVVGTAQSMVLVSWFSNTEISSIISYYPEGRAGESHDQMKTDLLSGEHKMILKGLFPNTIYMLIVKGTDSVGNQAISESHSFTTASDTRPPAISDINVEGSNTALINESENPNISQLVISWNTDEPAASQVEFGEGAGTAYPQKTQEDANLTYNHLVVISGLTPSKVYHLRAVSADKAGNTSHSVDMVAITPKETESALNLVITNLQQVFGFLSGN